MVSKIKPGLIEKDGETLHLGGRREEFFFSSSCEFRLAVGLGLVLVFFLLPQLIFRVNAGI